ncbi:type II toxin-antitoxin system RelE/ParE family toxin [Massilia glaciei]|uniref:Type II toxin-antitoxin system RelE/ParE family toxin n=1 Tax=Massilia glaciei TaxID=1524097 RepID=A0A2U2HGM9_9BURK|nr:type II toxin-antitoxin system RelE/ParE family toxin [Massilia glaciei]PWF44340.1 type II toxin-antitoxin system RelE/ParE family toxin [Massilia glaciei]
MPQVRLAPSALHDLQRLREFLRIKNPAAAKRAAAAIIKSIQMLGRYPQVGRPAQEMDIEYREITVEFGDTGYIVLYRYELDAVTVLSIRHQKEAGY